MMAPMKWLVATQGLGGLHPKEIDAIRDFTLLWGLFEEVLSEARDGGADVLKALLLIILRLRNNLFHGVKWQYFLQDQFENFSHANGVLMPAIGLAVSPP